MKNIIAICMVIIMVAAILGMMSVSGMVDTSSHQPTRVHTAQYVLAESNKCISYGMTALVDPVGNVTCKSK